MPRALEVIATSLDDALAAEQGGADRVELVAALERGGMTPPLRLVDAVLTRLRIPVRVIVRESDAHEVADPAERARLVDLAHQIGQRPVDGLVFGAVAGGRVDQPLLDAVAAAGRRPVTFHRAFEWVDDPFEALELLARHPAVDRVLSNGGEGDWTARVRRLADWSRAADGRLLMLAGGGLTAEAVGVLARTAGVREVHVGRLARQPATVDGTVSADLVAGLVRALNPAP
jgi:copper homeostasis protein